MNVDRENRTPYTCAPRWREHGELQKRQETTSEWKRKVGETKAQTFMKNPTRFVETNHSSVCVEHATLWIALTSVLLHRM
jgi:hypothetical protein